MASIVLRSGDREYRVEVDGDRVVVDGTPVHVPSRGYAVADGDKRWVFLDGDVYAFEVPRRGRGKRGGHHHGTLSSPMPATVVRISTAPGAQVKKGETLLVVEAMKMELPIRATDDGTVTAVNCSAGELVQPGVPLVEIDS